MGVFLESSPLLPSRKTLTANDINVCFWTDWMIKNTHIDKKLKYNNVIYIVVKDYDLQFYSIDD